MARNVEARKALSARSTSAGVGSVNATEFSSYGTRGSVPLAVVQGSSQSSRIVILVCGSLSKRRLRRCRSVSRRDEGKEGLAKEMVLSALRQRMRLVKSNARVFTDGSEQLCRISVVERQLTHGQGIQGDAWRTRRIGLAHFEAKKARTEESLPRDQTSQA
jgi:hypothetical protein